MNIYKDSLFLCFSLTVMPCWAKSHVSENIQRPNILYVFPDQMRNCAMGFWRESPFKESVHFLGDPVHTPNLNQFAKESVVLTSVYSNCPLSSPHRGSLLTGMFPENSGVPLNCKSSTPISNLRSDVKCISDVLKEAGYSCGYIGKLHVDHPTPNDPDHPGLYVESRIPAWDAYTPKERRHGFDYWYSYGTFDVHKHPHYWDTNGVRHNINEWSPDHETDKAIAYLQNKKQERDSKKPFFLMLAYNPPHSPYSSLNDCMERDFIWYKDKPLDSLLVRPNVDMSMEKAKCAPYYFASVTGIDRNFGRLLQELRNLGLDSNTIVIFSSDHGETMCSHGVEDAKNAPYTECFNVPFIIRYPDKLKSKVDTKLILSSPDIMPTILGLCGLKKQIPNNVEGKDYSEWLLNFSQKVPLRKGALYIKNEVGNKDIHGNAITYFPVARGIRTDKYTMVFTIDKQTKKIQSGLLYNDVDDPYQMQPLLLEQNKTLVKLLCKELASLLKEASDPWYKQKILNDIIPY